MKILVTGATGKLGGAVVDKLLLKVAAAQVSVLVRKQETVAAMQQKGLNAFLGSYYDRSSLEAAMQGTDKVLLISSTDEGDRMSQHRNVVDAAKKSGVGCIAYTSRSLQNKETLMNNLMLEHFETEDYIRQSGLQYTIFRNALYMAVLPLFVGKRVFEQGIFQPAGDGKVAFALRKEMGEAIANVLLETGCENETYNLTGSQAYSFDDVAAALAALSGKDIKYTSVAIPAFKEKMQTAGLPEPMIQKIIDFNTDIKNNQEAGVTANLEEKLGRKPTGLQEGLKLLFGF
jgi:NAD(P)H dehydrogenase (quinone)